MPPATELSQAVSASSVSLSTSPPPPAVYPDPVTRSSSAFVGATGIAGFDENPFSVQRGRVGPAPNPKRRGHMALPLVLMLVLVVVAGAGGAVYLVLHPSPRSSPGAAATDFVERISRGDFAGARSDIVPGQAATIGDLAAVPQLQALRQQTAGQEVQSARTSITASMASVQLRMCEELACSYGEAIPMVHVATGWYVDLRAYVASASAP